MLYLQFLAQNFTCDQYLKQPPVVLKAHNKQEKCSFKV